MKFTRIPKRLVPPSFHEEVGRRLSDYCIAIARMTPGDTSTFQVIGSGTFVVRDGRYSVLTAHHCLHRWKPEVRLGERGSDRIFFLTKRGYTPSAAQHELAERPLGRPRSRRGSRGPDLTLIQIPPGPVLDALRAIASFCPMNRAPRDVLREFCVDLAYVANAGYPAYGTAIRTKEKNVHADLNLCIGTGSLRRRDIERRGAWDYIECLCDFRTNPQLPTRFGGMSGGGIWIVLFKRDGDEFKVHDFALVGVMFYRTDLQRRRCRLRGHFVRSIYGRAWRTRAIAAPVTA